MRKRPWVRTGVVLAAHGSRRSEGQATLLRYARELQTNGAGLRVVCAYLEINRPNIPEALGKMAGEGMDRVVLVPFFLLAGRHTREDLPRMVRRARREYPGTKFYLASFIGFDPRLSAILADRIQKAK